MMPVTASMKQSKNYKDTCLKHSFEFQLQVGKPKDGLVV